MSRPFKILYGADERKEKSNTADVTPRDKVIKKMESDYRSRCYQLFELIKRLNSVEDKRSIEAVQKDIIDKEAELQKKSKNRPIVERLVLQDKIEILHAILAHKEKVGAIRLEISNKEIKLAGMKVQSKVGKSIKSEIVSLEQSIEALRKELRSLEMTDAQISNLQQQIENLRTRLGSALWSLMQYELSRSSNNYMARTASTLEITPKMGDIVPRGQSRQK